MHVRGGVLLVQCELEVTGLLFTEQSPSLPAEVDTSTQASGISSAPRPRAVGGSASKAKDHVLGEYPRNIHVIFSWMNSIILHNFLSGFAGGHFENVYSCGSRNWQWASHFNH